MHSDVFSFVPVDRCKGPAQSSSTSYVSSCNHRIVAYSAASSQNRRSILADIKEPERFITFDLALGSDDKDVHPLIKARQVSVFKGNSFFCSFSGFVNNLHGICTNTSDLARQPPTCAALLRVPWPLFTVNRISLAGRRSGNNMGGSHEGSFRIRSAADALLHRALISRLMEPNFTSPLLQSLCAVLHFGFSANWRGR